MLKRIARFVLLLISGLALSLGFALSHDSFAQRSEPLRKFTITEPLKGSYNVSLHGFIGKSSCKPFGISGVMEFDASGKVTGGALTMRIQDQPAASITIDQPSSYIVKGDGTGTINLRFVSSSS